MKNNTQPSMSSLPHLLITITLFIIISSTQSTLILPLHHSLSTTSSTTPHHHLQTTSHRQHIRHNRHNHHLSLPLSPGSDYTLSFSIGHRPITLYMDTGSDLVWFPCSPFECILCDDEQTTSTSLPPPISATSSAVPCGSPLCSAVHSSLPSSDLCAAASCPLETIETSVCPNPCPPFYYAYGDGSLIAHLRHDHLSMESLKVANFTFGCANSALAEPIGVAGFGRGPLSLPAQLSFLSPSLGRRFSYCLVSHSFDSDRLRLPSPLILGRDDDDHRRFTYTPMLDDPKHPYFYSVGLDAISIGSARIDALPSMRAVDAARGVGGTVVDSGTTYTMLPRALYERVARELDERVRRRYARAREAEAETGLGPCYHLGEEGVKVPRMVLHFAGNASVVLPRRNYFFGFERGEKGRVGCLMVMGVGGDEGEGGPAATLGNYQQQGFEVVYDLERRRVGFARRPCAALWESLARSP
ncbi:Protein ASPARTIC PROTEASE IN GUARD CELL 1 [Acorus calamus]|uniref:Protein ASPARTIC PROTEASE IN GUARD CELL 1 n=1 Tax=Acorus calamus TaxID=4465 RepID=A0AAV9FIV0_ACOCL|nr:Protein ASPARTIC PROTEASE IN GUARD CELL 1 [Acorus calamus]